MGTSRVTLHLTTLVLLDCSVFFLSACRRAMNHVCTTRPITFAPSFTHVQTVSHSHLCFTSNLDNKTLIREPFSFIQRVNIYIFRKFSGSFGKLLSIFQWKSPFSFWYYIRALHSGISKPRYHHCVSFWRQNCPTLRTRTILGLIQSPFQGPQKENCPEQSGR